METDQITQVIIGCAMRVSNSLGVGFKEKVYEKALVIELKKAGLTVEQQKRFSVTYEGIAVGDFIADMLVNNCVMVELKAMQAIDQFHQAQLLNYLKATGIRVGLVLNFGTPRLGIKRMVL
jgi:GxxExxY protein